MLEIVSNIFSNFPIYKQKNWSSESNETNEIPYFALTVLFSVFVFLLEWFIEQRQIKNFKTIKTLPKELHEVVTQEVFTRSNDYGADKLTFKAFEANCSFIFNTLLLFYGWLPYSWDLSVATVNYLTSHYITYQLSSLTSEIIISCCFITITSLVEAIFSLPFSLYFTFVIEEKHGFNKSVSILSLFLDNPPPPLLLLIRSSYFSLLRLWLYFSKISF